MFMGKGTIIMVGGKMEITLTDLEIRSRPCEGPNFNTTFHLGGENRSKIENIKRKGPLTNRLMRKRTIIVVEEKGCDNFY